MLKIGHHICTKFGQIKVTSYCKYILSLLVLIIALTIFNTKQLYAQNSITNEIETIETNEGNLIGNTINDGKLPKPIQPVKKKQSYKRLLVSKRAAFTEINCGILAFFAHQNKVLSAAPYTHQEQLINSFFRTLIKHNSLYYLF